VPGVRAARDFRENLIQAPLSAGRMAPRETADGASTGAGELVRLEFDLWAESGGRTELVDTTHEEVAQAAGVTGPPGRPWGPRPHQIGGEVFPAGIEHALVGVPVGKEVEREFAPGEAFGERDANLIELFTMHQIERLPEMRRDDAHLDLGTPLTINGRRGRVVTLTAARVRVDFNPPFAGRKVRGKFRVVEKIDEPADQVRALVELVYGYGSEFHVEVREKLVTLRVPDRTKFDPLWFAAKARIVEKLRGQLHPETIRFVEEWATPAAEAKAPEATEKKAPHKASSGATEPGGAPAAKPAGAKHAAPEPAEGPKRHSAAPASHEP
jgi:FKBP-type peptidyl-prolyl cis-trans isomerase 2